MNQDGSAVTECGCVAVALATFPLTTRIALNTYTYTILPIYKQKSFSSRTTILLCELNGLACNSPSLPSDVFAYTQ